MADTSERLCIVGFGEVLWDVFPKYKVPGGAPFNVIAHSKIMGADAHIISATGTDRNGYSLREYIRSKGISTDYLQLSSVLNTGTVDVTTNRNGEPTYRINESVAWDNIEYNDKMVDLVVRANAFIYGTLASRSEISFNSLMKLLDYSNLSVLDLNIRQEYFTGQQINDLLLKTDILKVNNYELELLGTLFNIDKDDIFRNLASEFNIEMIIKTSGEKGATLYSRGQLISSKGIKTRVRNTVGSGDAFLAAFMLNYLRGETPESALARANILGAFVAGTEGAIPDYSINDDWQPKLKDRIE